MAAFIKLSHIGGSRVKFGHQQAIKAQVVLGNNRIFGYVKGIGRLVWQSSKQKEILSVLG